MTDALTPEEMNAYQSMQDKMDQALVEMGVLLPPDAAEPDKAPTTSEIQTMDKPLHKASEESKHPLELAVEELNRRSRASGLTVREIAPSNSTEYVVTFPPVRASVIPKDLIQAYLETEFRVLGELPFTLRIGQVSSDLLGAHKRHRVDCSAFVTAWNPHSQSVDDATNREMQSALANDLKSRCLHFIEGVGEHPSNEWPGEQSYLVLGLALEASKALGTRLKQNAIVWSGSDGTPQLILLR